MPSKFSWQRHIGTKLAKCKKIFYFIKRNVPFTIPARRKLLSYQSLVLFILLNGSVMQPSVIYMHKMKSFQSRVFRWIISDSDYISALQRFSFLPVCYQKIQSNMVLLWKMIKKQADVKSQIQISFFNSKSARFSVPKTLNFCSEDNFFVKFTRCANELLKLKVINFDMPLGIFRTNVHIFVVKNYAHFNIDSSCSYFVKCFCKNCRS